MPIHNFDIFDAAQRLWTVYPYTNDIVFAKGDRVFVNLHGGGLDGEGVVVSDGPIADPSSKWRGRYKVTFDSDGSSAHVNPNRLYPRFPVAEHFCDPAAASSSSTTAATTTVVMVSETVHYRELAHSSVLPTDYAIDIGCSSGMCTVKLHQKTKRTLGIDISDEILEKARTDFPEVKFEKLNILEEVERFVGMAEGATVIFADIGGDRDFESMAAVADIVLRHLKPRIFVIKNRAMVRHAAAFLGREVRRHKWHDKIKWQGRMEICDKERGWVDCRPRPADAKKSTTSNVPEACVDEVAVTASEKADDAPSASFAPWWAEGMVSKPDDWLKTWMGLEKPLPAPAVLSGPPKEE